MQIKYTLSDIEKAVSEFWQTAKNYHVITFTGALGAGKTTFISALCKYLKIAEVPSSPTFALINEYTFNNEKTITTIYHTDWYRINSDDEAVNAGMETILSETKNYCFIEWPQRAKSLVPQNALHVLIDTIDEHTRSIEILENL